AAELSGMTSLRGDGARWIADGTTSLAELLRVSRASSTAMDAFRWEAVDGAGRMRQGLLESDTARAVRDQLRAGGLTPTAVDAAASRGDAFSGVRLPAPLLAMTTRQLATL